jgi:hypothetical protein
VEELLRVLVVAVSVAGVALGLLLDPVAGGSGRLSLGGLTLPGLCAFYELTGLPCPGCGLTRSWVSVLHGDLGASLSHHSLGWLVLLYALAQGARHAAWLAIPARRGRIERYGSRLDRGIVVLGILLVLVWVPRVIVLLLGG